MVSQADQGRERQHEVFLTAPWVAFLREVCALSQRAHPGESSELSAIVQNAPSEGLSASGQTGATLSLSPKLRCALVQKLVPSAVEAAKELQGHSAALRIENSGIALARMLKPRN